jgi:hypothetical protein
MTGWLRTLKDRMSSRRGAQRASKPERAEKKARAEALRREHQRAHHRHRK